VASFHALSASKILWKSSQLAYRVSAFSLCVCFRISSPIKSGMYDRQQSSVVKGFAQEFDGTFAHGTNSHLGITMRSDEDDRYSALLGLKLRLQFKTCHSRYANVGDQARSLVPRFGIQELFRGTEAERGQPVRLNQILQSALH
jgi:hypothetical protein